MKSTIFSAMLISASMLTSAGAMAAADSAKDAAPKAHYHIRWQIAHTPVEYFKQTAEKFSSLVGEKTNGRVSVEIITQFDLADNQNLESINNQSFDKVKKGEMEMGQIYSTVLNQYSKPFYALNVPFLFRDDAHVTQVVEGPIGEKLLAGLESSAGVKGLAFTYSGGIQGIALRANGEFTNLDSLKGLRHRTYENYSNFEVIKALGMTPVLSDQQRADNGRRLYLAENFEKDLVDSADVTPADMLYAFHAKKNAPNTLIKTRHNVVLTSLVMNQKFYDSLPADIQKAVKESAVLAGRHERAHVVADAKKIESQLKKEGIKIVTLSDAQTKQMQAMLKAVGDKFTKVAGDVLVRSIAAVGASDQKKYSKLSD